MKSQQYDQTGFKINSAVFGAQRRKNGKVVLSAAQFQSIKQRFPNPQLITRKVLSDCSISFESRLWHHPNLLPGDLVQFYDGCPIDPAVKPLSWFSTFKHEHKPHVQARYHDISQFNRIAASIVVEFNGNNEQQLADKYCFRPQYILFIVEHFDPKKGELIYPEHHKRSTTQSDAHPDQPQSSGV